MIAAASLRPGDVCTFRTMPIHPALDLATGRHGALKVLIVGESIVYAVLDGVFQAIPSFDEVMRLPVLRQRRFAFTGKPAVRWAQKAWSINLIDFAVLGNSSVTPTELTLVPNLPSIGPWSSASVDVEGEWRWEHDREAFKREVELAAIARAATDQAERQRYKARLGRLTWETLLAECLFARWSPSPPFPPASFVEALRARFRAAIVDLSAMNFRPGKPAVRRVLRNLVEQINTLDEAHGGLIETEEREDLLTSLSELAILARQRDLMREIDDWRAW